MSSILACVGPPRSSDCCRRRRHHEPAWFVCWCGGRRHHLLFLLPFFACVVRVVSSPPPAPKNQQRTTTAGRRPHRHDHAAARTPACCCVFVTAADKFSAEFCNAAVPRRLHAPVLWAPPHAIGARDSPSRSAAPPSVVENRRRRPRARTSLGRLLHAGPATSHATWTTAGGANPLHVGEPQPPHPASPAMHGWMLPPAWKNVQLPRQATAESGKIRFWVL